MDPPAGIDVAGIEPGAIEPSRLRTLFRTAFSQAPLGLAIVDADGRVLVANDALGAIAGLRVEALVGMSIGDLLDDEALDPARLLAGETARTSATCRLRLPDGNSRWVQTTVACDGQRPPSLIYQLEDVTERERLQHQLEYLIDHDGLTGLLNRRRFEQELDQALARSARSREGGAVLMIDLDGFKAINDEFGHAIGDELLREVASALRERCRASDVLARLSGDEFALLVPGASRSDAELVAAALVAVVARHPVAVGEERAGVSASIGAAMIDDQTTPELLSLADGAMYAAKDQGRNRFVVFDSADPESSAPGRLAEAARLRRALRRGGFVLHCQPIVRLADDHITQYELLVRMRGEVEGELISPGGFLYAAERFGLIAELDAWVISQAAELIAAHAHQGRRIVLAVNLSGRSIGQTTLSAHIDRVLDRTGIDPTSLIFELTETAAIANLDAARRFADRLHHHGCALALDDFGAGFASFLYLKSLPFDYVKIDGNFVQGIVTSRVDQLLITSIVGVARGMGIKTVAEFVTSQATEDLLRDSGVDYAQGFYIASPAPVDEVLMALGPASVE